MSPLDTISFHKLARLVGIVLAAGIVVFGASPSIGGQASSRNSRSSRSDCPS